MLSAVQAPRGSPRPARAPPRDLDQAPSQLGYGCNPRKSWLSLSLSATTFTASFCQVSMPLHNVTIDDVSALIGYHNPNGLPWKDSPSNDTSLGSYSDQTYHSSNQTGARSTFRFQGTAVYLFAATRWMHGKYDIFMDDQLAYQGNGHTKSSIFNQLVFNATSLSAGWHNLTFVNTDPGLYIEVDYISWTTVMPAALVESSGIPISHTLGNMAYDVSLWEGGESSSSPYIVTGTNGAEVNITFKGNGIELYGRTGPDYGVFSAQVDNYDSHELDAYSGRVHNTILVNLHCLYKRSQN
ncbi:unnamed protein product [Rhizoctonia solani]|uniref:Uncharacterized protein n=1 Tax=Rhizoctonia solani TaxID=456999 RepID=A0A8H2XX26_9AGAM|nr:unnamed protein product [Rhizoctonia solani]